MTEQGLQDARKRAAGYDYVDGTIEIGHGAVYATLGILLWIFNTISTGGQYKWLYAAGVLGFSLVASVVVGTLVTRYKEQVTYPRTGRVSYERPAGAEARDALLLIGASLVIAAAAILLEGWYTRIPAIIGATIALILFYSGRRAQLSRMQWVAMAPFLIGMLAAFLDMDDTSGSAYVMTGAGLALVLAGLAALRRYLAANPAPADEAS